MSMDYKERNEHLECVISDLRKECNSMRVYADSMRLTLRDKFAMVALPAIMQVDENATHAIGAAKMAYAFADAMMEARK